MAIVKALVRYPPDWLSPLEATSTLTTTLDPTEPGERGIANIIKLTNYSALPRLVRVTAWMLRFLNIIKKKADRGPLPALELQAAHKLWILDRQSSVYAKELVNLISKTADLLPLVRQLRLFLLEDLLAVSTRMTCWEKGGNEQKSWYWH